MRLQRLDDAELFDGFADPGPSSNAGRIDQQVFPALMGEQGIHGIPRRARRIVHQYPLPTHPGVQKRRFSGAILSQDGVDRTAVAGEIDVVERPYAGEMFGYALQFDMGQ